MTNTEHYKILKETFKKRFYSKMQKWTILGIDNLKKQLEDLKENGTLLKNGGEEFFKLIFED